MKKWNVAAIRAAKGKTKLGCVTAYDACFARLADEAGAPIVLVGDSQGMNCLGYETTLPVNMSDTIAAVAAVSRGAKNALVVGDMPFGSYQCGDDEAVKNAVAIIKAGADAVKLEGGASVCSLIRRLTTAGIPVLAHVGMTPQSVNEYGGFKKQGKTRRRSRSSRSALARGQSAMRNGSSCTIFSGSTRRCRRSSRSTPTSRRPCAAHLPRTSRKSRTGRSRADGQRLCFSRFRHVVVYLWYNIHFLTGKKHR